MVACWNTSEYYSRELLFFGERGTLKRPKKLPPLEDDQAWKKLKHPDDWKIPDASTKIDECLYGSAN
jgi:hypothetical protein